MRNLKQLSSFEEIKTLFANLNDGLLEITSDSKINFCSNEDDAVIVQIGFTSNHGFEIDADIANNASDIHQELTRYFDSGCYTMLVLSLSEKGYSIYADDADSDYEPLAVESESISGLIEAIEKLA